jgi:hypothetical protein
MEDKESFNPLGWAIWFTEDVKDKKLDPTDIASVTERLTRAYMRGYEQGKSDAMLGPAKTFLSRFDKLTTINEGD